MKKLYKIKSYSFLLTLIIVFHAMTLGAFADDTLVLDKIASPLASAMADASAGEEFRSISGVGISTTPLSSGRWKPKPA